MNSRLWSLGILTLISACSATPTRYPTYVPPTITQVEVEDESSGFSSEAEDQKADEVIASAQRIYEDVQARATSFSISNAKCEDHSMESSLASLRSVDDVAQHYLQVATTSSSLADREAAMDVLDELNTAILDGILDITKAYRARKCFAHAQHILTQAKSLYAGPAYANWVNAMETEAAAIASEQVAKPLSTKTSDPAKRAVKKRSVKKAPQPS